MRRGRKSKNRKPKSKQQVKEKNDNNESRAILWFLLEFAYELVTWVGVAGCFVAASYFLSTGNYRGLFWFGIALGITILIMVGLFADRHWFRNHKQRAESVATAPSQSPARIEVTDIELTERSRVPVVGVRLFNLGQRAATDVRAYAAAAVTGGKIPRDYVFPPYDRFDGPPIYLAGGQSKPQTLVLDKFKPRLMERLNDGNALLYVYGTIDYVDEGDGSRATYRYCMLYNRFSGIFEQADWSSAGTVRKRK